MRTQLDQFCKQFDSLLRPFAAEVGELLGALESAERRSPAAALRGEAGELRHQLKVLLDKVSDQQAYVLIFGPLKSGKSTLMNALAGSYVSEVSSLPAYPCLVFVGHGDERRYDVTEYGGATRTFTDTDELHKTIEDSHVELADTIRATEDAGKQFEAKQHLPRAIRRIDVRLPTKRLQESGAVLVDTPGLYSRMRFGYDQMTRDFRDAAACAVFVVKSDNLFLEQVFEEFHQLLELFSRIFLVVNVDTTKRDVSPAGELVPSIEQTSPARIVEAFRSLAMTSPLRAATAAGRLRLYPVDLLHAASAVLRGRKGATLPDDFRRFRDDLMSYLASTDYLASFLTDSLQRARSLLDDASELTSGEEAAALREELEVLDDRARECEQDLASIAACVDRDWSQAFARFREELDAEVRRRSRDRAARAMRAMSAAMDTWFLSSASLQSLLDSDWMPELVESRDVVEQAAGQCFEQACARGDAGMQLDGDVASFLRSMGIGVVDVRRQAAADLGPVPPPVDEPLVDAAAIPIRRGVLDLLTFRAEPKVRERIFGPAERPDRKIDARVKRSQLGEAAKFAMRQRLMWLRNDVLPGLTTTTLERYGSKLERLTAERLRGALAALEPDLRASLEELTARRARLRAQLEPLEKVRDAADGMRAKLHALSSQFLAEIKERDGGQETVVLEPQPGERAGGGAGAAPAKRQHRV